MGQRPASTAPMVRCARLITIDELADRCGIPQDLVRHLVTLGLVDPPNEGVELFSPEVTARTQRIMRLHRDLDINFSGIALVLDLLERIEVLEARLQRSQDRSAQSRAR